MADTNSLVTRTPNYEFSPYKRARIATRYSLGLTPRALFVLEGVSPRTLPGVVKRYEKQKSGRSRLRSGRLRKLDDRVIRYILRSITNNLFVSFKKIKEETSLDVHERTISQELIRRGIIYS
jgi:hypothetical protein